MKRSEVKVGVRVKDICTDNYSYGQVGTLMDNCALAWVRFDDDTYNNTCCAAEFGDGVRCTAVYYTELEVVKDES